MFDHLIYYPNIQNTILLDKKQSHYFLNVLRLKVGSTIYLIDGSGKYYKGQLTSIQSKQIKVTILETLKSQAKDEHFIHLAIAPPKSADRLAWLVEKTAELGIHQITFLQTKFSQRHKIDLDRLYRKTIAASQQALRASLPTLTFSDSFSFFIHNLKTHDQKFIAIVRKNQPSIPLLQLAKTKKKYCILIGPEGGFEDGEIKMALEHDFKPIALGSNRLRTETAAISVCGALHFINN